MDTEQLRTFLEVNRTRHFGLAAKNLFLSQSAVSSRIQSLEELLGTPLFERTRNDIQLTPAGHRLVKHAENILAAWNRAKHDLIVESGISASLTVAGMPSLWDISLQQWLHTLHQLLPEIAVNAEVGDADNILRRLLEGTLDIGFTFDTPKVARIESRQIASISLLLVSSRQNLSITSALEQDYVYVDWGISFAIAHAHHFPDMGTPTTRLPLGRIALNYLLSCGGCAYIAEPMLGNALDTGQLFKVIDAPIIERPAYALFSSNTDRTELIQKVLDCIN